MLWNKLQNHDVDCYFYNTTLIKSLNPKNKEQIVHADAPFLAKPIFIHVPKAENSLGLIENQRPIYEADEPESKHSKKNPILLDQAEWNDLIKDLNLSKGNAELLGSRLKEKNLLNRNYSSIQIRLVLFECSPGVLLQNGNEFPSIPVADTSHLKECYEFMTILLKINYHAHCWSIC